MEQSRNTGLGIPDGVSVDGNFAFCENLGLATHIGG